MKRNHLLKVAIILCTVLVLTGCPFQNVKQQSSSDLYYTALGFWQSTLENFKLVYTQATPADRAEMVDTMDYLLTVKRTILNTWAASIANNDQAGIYNQQAAWKQAKNKIILEVVSKYFPDKGGV